MIAENGIEPVLQSIENSYGMTAPNLVKVTMRENETADSIGALISFLNFTIKSLRVEF